MPLSPDSGNTNNPGEINPFDAGVVVADYINAMIAYWDKDQVCRFANHAYMEWFGKSKEEMINKMTMKELLGGPLHAMNLPYIHGALNGEKQVFEREILLPDGQKRNTLATYYPDYSDKGVRGFFVHVADVSYIKDLESRLMESKRYMLRNAILTEENEKANVMYSLRDNVNQTLVYCKMMIQHRIEEGFDKEFNSSLLLALGSAINELNSLSTTINRTQIEDLGLNFGIKTYLDNIRYRLRKVVSYTSQDQAIEELPVIDKLALFRIVQNYLNLLEDGSACSKVSIHLEYKSPDILLQFRNNDKNFIISKDAKEFLIIANRIEYYGSSFEEKTEGEESVFNVRISIKS